MSLAWALMWLAGHPDTAGSGATISISIDMTLSNSNTLFPLLLYPSFPSQCPTPRASLRRREVIDQGLHLAADDSLHVDIVLFGIEVGASRCSCNEAEQ